MANTAAQGWLVYFGNIFRALAGTTVNSDTVQAVATTATKAASASIGLGITTDVGEGFKAVSAVANLVAQRDKELNAPEMIQAANATKIQALKDHAAAVIQHAEETGDLTAVKLLLS